MTHDKRVESVQVFFGRTVGDDKWVAATCTSPFFYVELDTEAEAHAFAEEAVRLYSENRENPTRISPPAQRQAEQLPRSLTDVTSELMYA